MWITFDGLPEHLFHNSALFSIARLVGNPNKIDASMADGKKPGKARVPIDLDVTKPRIELHEKAIIPTYVPQAPSPNTTTNGLDGEFVPSFGLSQITSVSGEKSMRVHGSSASSNRIELASQLKYLTDLMNSDFIISHAKNIKPHVIDDHHQHFLNPKAKKTIKEADIVDSCLI
ncbi:hypothetical protein ACH5RR_002681 [Cinchona calisaya]|uniref:DUF4283 domain-containing protein n=1 Tax=Cinchona calisaya TaxID=153742 RepID=A0ABD3ASN8_9GENT